MANPKYDLTTLLSGLHDEIQQKLDRARASFAHPGTMGDASEKVWIELFNYLPDRYKAVKGHVVDKNGNFSEQMDVVIFDRQYSPFILNFADQIIIPAESVYAVFEAKQTVTKPLIEYAQKKIASVRKLERTSLPIPHAGGTYPPKPLHHILGGVLSFDSDWKNPPLGEPMRKVLLKDVGVGRLDIGCIASHGHFNFEDGIFTLTLAKKPATSFLFYLLSRLQAMGTVPMIDIMAYAQWLK